MVRYSSLEIVITDFSIKMEESESRRASCGANAVLFLSVGQNSKRPNRHRAAVAANVPIINCELDRGRRRKRAAAVFLILDFVTVAFRLEYTIPHESAGI